MLADEERRRRRERETVHVYYTLSLGSRYSRWQDVPLTSLGTYAIIILPCTARLIACATVFLIHWPMRVGASQLHRYSRYSCASDRRRRRRRRRLLPCEPFNGKKRRKC